MSRFTITFLSSVALAFALTLSAGAHAGPAEDFVRNKHASLIAQLKKPASPAKNKSIDAMLNGLFDYDKLTKDALAKHYDGLKPEQVAKLKELLQTLVAKNYKKNIQKTIDYEVKFLGDADAPSGAGKLVRTKVQKKGSKAAPVEVNYLLYQKNGAWVVYDIETEGSSMVRNYRNQFGKTIRRDGFDVLIKKLQERVSEK